MTTPTDALRAYYNAVIGLRSLPVELILYICQLADFVSPHPDLQTSVSRMHKPSKFHRPIFRTTEARKIVPWFRTPPFSRSTLHTTQRIEVHACSHASYPASRSLQTYIFYDPLSAPGGTTQRRVPWKNFSLRLVSPAYPKRAKTRWDDSPLSWPCFERSYLPPDAEPQPSDPGLMLVDRQHELWNWFEAGDWLEVTFKAHFSWELASFRVDGTVRVFRWWEPSVEMLALIQRRSD